MIILRFPNRTCRRTAVEELPNSTFSIIITAVSYFVDMVDILTVAVSRAERCAAVTLSYGHLFDLNQIFIV